LEIADSSLELTQSCRTATVENKDGILSSDL
jgi:hypothetical protein